MLAAVFPEAPFQRDEFDFISGKRVLCVHKDLLILISR
jgi:hypothetical protein